MNVIEHANAKLTASIMYTSLGNMNLCDPDSISKM